MLFVLMMDLCCYSAYMKPISAPYQAVSNTASGLDMIRKAQHIGGQRKLRTIVCLQGTFPSPTFQYLEMSQVQACPYSLGRVGEIKNCQKYFMCVVKSCAQTSSINKHKGLVTVTSHDIFHKP